MDSRAEHKAPPVTEVLLAIENCWEGERQFAFSTYVSHAPMKSQLSRSTWAVQIGLDWEVGEDTKLGGEDWKGNGGSERDWRRQSEQNTSQQVLKEPIQK